MAMTHLAVAAVAAIAAIYTDMTMNVQRALSDEEAGYIRRYTHTIFERTFSFARLCPTISTYIKPSALRICSIVAPKLHE